jgi:hypothetical protein
MEIFLLLAVLLLQGFMLFVQSRHMVLQLRTHEALMVSLEETQLALFHLNRRLNGEPGLKEL